ncbi:MAG: phosphoribosylanthranilate isomerase [Flavobacteriales bacterium]
MDSLLKIKVCGLKEATNIINVSSLSPDFLGFIHYPKSERFVGNLFALPELPKHQKKVAVLVNEPLESSIKIFQQGYDFLQLHGNESPEYCQKLKTQNISIIKAFGIGENYDFSVLNSYQPYTDFFLFDTKSPQYGGTGKKFNWNLLENYTFEKPFLLSGGITKNEVEAILNLDHPQLAGIDLNSGFEISPGIKNIKDLAFFIHKIKNSL